MWDANTDSLTSGYFVYTADAAGNPLGRSDVHANTSATLSSLVDGTTYVFYVTAYNSTGEESDPSNKVTYMAAPKPPPVVTDQTLETLQNQSVPVVLNGSSPLGRPLTYRVPSGPSHGSLSGAAPFLTYTPTYEFTGNDSFIYVANDGLQDSTPGVVSILVKPVNHPPVAHSKNVQTAEDAMVTFSLSASDADENPLSFSILSGPTHGVLSGTVPNLTYTPNPNFYGTDALSYRASDGSLQSEPATIIVTVAPVNDPPHAEDKNIQTVEDLAASVRLSGTDTEGSILSYSISKAPANGTLTGTGPNLVYMPAPGFHGTDSFIYVVSDGGAISRPATVSILVAPINDVPLAHSKSVQTLQNQSQAVRLTGEDYDGDPLSFSIVSGPAHGHLTGTAPNLTYVPALNYLGVDSFKFVVNDGALTSAPATISISVISANANVKIRRAALARP